MAYFPQDDPFAHLRDPNSKGQQQQNAQSGATQSIPNATVQGMAAKTGSGGNPFEAMLQHVTAFNAMKNGRPMQTGGPAGGPDFTAKFAPQMQTGGPAGGPDFTAEFAPQLQTGGPAGGPDFPAQFAPQTGGTEPAAPRTALPQTATKSFSNNIENPTGPGEPDPGNAGQPAPTTPSQPPPPPDPNQPVTPLPGPQLPKPTGGNGGTYTGSDGQQRPIPPVPQGVDPALWRDVTGYVTEAGLQGHDYSWLWTHPNAVQEFRAWAVANPNRARDVDIVDWLRHNYGRAQGVTANHSLAGRRGYDTYVFSPTGVPWGHGQDGTGGQGINPTAPQPPVNSIDANGVPLPPGYRAPSNPNGTGGNGGPGNQQAPPSGPPPPPPPGTVPPPNTGGPVDETGFGPEFTQPPGPTGPNANGPVNETGFGPKFKDPDWAGEFNPNEGDTFKKYEDLLNPLFQRQQDQFARKLRAQGALTGNIDSGGFGQNMAEGLAELGANQSSILADKVSTGHEKALDRVLQKYGVDTGAKTAMHQIDTQKFIAQIQDDTARLGIKTNAELERYIADRKNELERYGIDTNKWLEQYKADVQREVGFYSADASIKAASLHASAAQAAAGASAAAAQYDAQVRRELGLIGFDIERENNIMRFILGLGDLGGDYLDNIIGTSPDWWLNNTPWPGGDTVVRP